MSNNVSRLVLIFSIILLISVFVEYASAAPCSSGATNCGLIVSPAICEGDYVDVCHWNYGSNLCEGNSGTTCTDVTAACGPVGCSESAPVEWCFGPCCQTTFGPYLPASTPCATLNSFYMCDGTMISIQGDKQYCRGNSPLCNGAVQWEVMAPSFFSCAAYGGCNPNKYFPNSCVCNDPMTTYPTYAPTACLWCSTFGADGIGCNCVSNYGNSCTSSANACGATNTGTIDCAGFCTASPPPVPAEVCDSIDNDCDGTKNEGLGSYYGEACNTGESGICAAGTNLYYCDSSVNSWTAYCQRDVEEKGVENVAAQCVDGLDTDCDGKTDCADPDCLNVISEVCDSIDNDCDGTKNDGLANINVETCTSAPNICGVKGEGTRYQYCNAGVNDWTWSTCTATVPPVPSEDTNAKCHDGLDNDCDGSTDCADPNCVGVASEVCNAIDDDCKEGVDEDFDCIQNSPGCNSTCGWRCKISLISNAPDCYVDQSGTSFCSNGDKSNITFSFVGSECTSADHVFAYYRSSDYSCTMGYYPVSPGLMTNRMVGTVTGLSNTEATTKTLNFVFNGTLSSACAGKTLSHLFYAILYTSSNTPLSNQLSGLLSKNINLVGCTPKGYIPYKDRIGFAESQNFLVPTKAVAPVITSICNNYINESIVTARPPLFVNGYVSGIVADTSQLTSCDNIFSIVSTQDYVAAHNYCISSGYNGGTFSDKGNIGGRCVMCYYNDASNSDFGREYNVNFNASLSGGLPSNYQIVCSDVSDGVCPNDFSSVELCKVYPNGTSDDFDCGNHIFVNCTDVLNDDLNSVGNICTTQDPQDISDERCMIQKTAMLSDSQMHTQCVNGAVIQDNVTGCPVCLKNGETMTYNTGVVVSRGEELVPVKTTLVTMGYDDGRYYTCPSDEKYMLAPIPGGVQCKLRPAWCDEGYRDSNTNDLLRKCNQPLTWNSTTKEWVLTHPNCLKLTGDKYTNYCGLNVWYNNYEIYDDQYKIIVR